MRELLYLAAMFHDTGIPSPVPDVDFTVRSAALATESIDAAEFRRTNRELVANAIAMHHTPGVGAEAYLFSPPERPSMSSGFAWLGFKREFAGLFRTEAKQVPHGRAWYLYRFALSVVTIRLAPFRG